MFIKFAVRIRPELFLPNGIDKMRNNFAHHFSWLIPFTLAKKMFNRKSRAAENSFYATRCEPKAHSAREIFVL